MFLLTTLFNGGRIVLHCKDDMNALMSEFLLYNPTIVAAAPRLFKNIMHQFTMELGTNPSDEFKQGLLAKYRKIFGNRLEAVCPGGASSGPHLLQFLAQLWPDKIVTDGYGASEVGGIAINEQIIPGVQVKLIDVPESGYFSSNNVGEICVKTKTMFSGYWTAGGIDRSALDEE